MYPSRAVAIFHALRLLGGRRLAAVTTLSAALVGCQISSGGTPGEGAVVVRAQALGLTAPIDRFEVTVSPAERSTWLLADSTGAFGGSLALPAGAQALTATAYAGASAVGKARADVQVIAGQSADVLLRLRGDQLPARTPLITSLVASTTHALAGQTLSVSATADAGGDPVAFTWTDQGCGTFASPTAGSTPWSRSTPGTCRLTVIASSAEGEDSQSIAVTVTAPHPAPAITSLTASATSAAVGQALSLSATADAGGDPVHFSWSDHSCGSSFSSPSTPSTIWLHSAPGVCTLTVTAKSEGGEDSRTVSITVGAPRAAPTLSSLVASPARVVAGQMVTLTASASAGTDPVTYAWSDQGCGSFSSTAGAVATWSRSSPGACLLTVTATSLGRNTSKSVSVVVTRARPAAITSLSASPANPTAGQSTTLSAAADAGGSPITYTWSDGGCGAFSSSEGARAIWSRSTPGSCTLTVTASSLGGSDSRSATVSVVAAHPAPAISSFAVPASVLAGQGIEVSASASAGQDPVSYAWSDQGCGSFASASASTTTWSRSTPGTCTLTVTASSLGGSDSRSATVSVVAAHPAPAISSFAVPASVLAGQGIEVSASASAGQDPVSFAWSDQGCGSFASASASTTTWSRSTPGTCTLTVTASSLGGSDSRSATVSVVTAHPAPAISSFAVPASVLAGQGIEVSASASAGQDPVSYAWSDQGCGSFASASASTTTWSRSTPGTCTLTVTASSLGGSDFRSATVSVVAAHPAPAISSFTVPASALVGQGIEVSASASAGQDPVSFAWSDQGCGSFASASASTTTWSRSTPGTCTLTLTASSLGGSDSRSATVSVVAAHPAPVISSFAVPSSALAGQGIEVSASASAGQDPVSFAWSDQGCGSFASASASTTTWSRSTPGTCTLTVTASSLGGSDSRSATVSVVAAHPAPAISSFTVPASALAGQGIEVSASASAGQDPVSFAWSDQGCGSFASASASTTTWSRSTPGTCTLTVTASSLGGSDSRSATVSVHELPPEGTPVRSRVDDFPAPPNGRTAIAPDRCALALILRDRTPSASGDLFSFFRASAQSAGDAWYLMASADGGASWTWFSASNAEPNPAPASDWNHDSTLAQDSVDYKVHHLYWRSGQTLAEYNRIALNHDGSGHISGWSWEAENVAGPVFSTSGSNGNFAKMTLNEAVDGNGQKVLVLFAVDQPSGTCIARLVATRTAPGAAAFSPTGLASWKKLTDVEATGYDVLGSYNSDSSIDAAAMANYVDQPADTMQQHTTDHCWQQLPADGSLHAFFGPYYYNDQTTTGEIRRWRLVRSGANWALDVSINGSEVSSSDGDTRPQMGGCYASPNFVWLTYGKPGSGLVVDKVGTSGSWISNALPSPDSTPDAWWYAALSVRGDEATAFLIWERWSLDVHTWRESSGYFDGKEWKVVDESDFWTANGVNGWNGAANWLHGAWPDGLTVFAYPYSDWATDQQRHHSHTISVQP